MQVRAQRDGGRELRGGAIAPRALDARRLRGFGFAHGMFPRRSVVRPNAGRGARSVFTASGPDSPAGVTPYHMSFLLFP